MAVSLACLRAASAHGVRRVSLCLPLHVHTGRALPNLPTAEWDASKRGLMRSLLRDKFRRDGARVLNAA